MVNGMDLYDFDELTDTLDVVLQVSSGTNGRRE